MNQQPIVHLNYQCSEPFWKFKKENGVDFCKTCNHHIIDFTSLTNEEIIKVLKEQKGKTCGKFYEDQIIIDEQTNKGSSLSKIILASAIATITTLTSTAQSNDKGTIITEQAPVANSENQIERTIETLPEVECLQIPEEEIIQTENEGVKKYYIGSSNIYVSKKFPFVHKRRRFMGRTVTGCPSF